MAQVTNPVQAKALSAEELAEYHDNIGGWSLGVRRLLATIAERDKQIAAVKKLCKRWRIAALTWAQQTPQSQR